MAAMFEAEDCLRHRVYDATGGAAAARQRPDTQGAALHKDAPNSSIGPEPANGSQNLNASDPRGLLRRGVREEDLDVFECQVP